MMIATGFPAIAPLESAARKAGDYRDGLLGGKAAQERLATRPCVRSAAKTGELRGELSRHRFGITQPQFRQ
jgi:hypothetical protein